MRELGKIEQPLERLLQQTEFFKEISAVQLRQLGALCRSYEYERHEMLFIEGTEGSNMFLLLSGSVQLSKDSAAGQELVIRLIKPGEVFAEVVLFESRHYPVSAMALTTTRVMAVARTAVRQLLDQSAFRDEFIQMLMRKQRYLVERVRYLNSYDVEERLWRFLHEHYGDVAKVNLVMSKRDLAAAIGSTPETLSRLLGRLKKRGLLIIENQQWLLPDRYWEDLP